MIIASALVLWVLGCVMICTGTSARGQSTYDLILILSLIAGGATFQFLAVLLILPG